MPGRPQHQQPVRLQPFHGEPAVRLREPIRGRGRPSGRCTSRSTPVAALGRWRRQVPGGEPGGRPQPAPDRVVREPTTNSPRHSSSSPVALTAARTPAVASWARPGRPGRAPAAAGSRPRPGAGPAGEGGQPPRPGQESGGLAEQRRDLPAAEEGHRQQIAARPVADEPGQVPAARAQPPGQHPEHHPHAKGNDHGDGQGDRFGAGPPGQHHAGAAAARAWHRRQQRRRPNAK